MIHSFAASQPPLLICKTGSVTQQSRAGMTFTGSFCTKFAEASQSSSELVLAVSPEEHSKAAVGAAKPAGKLHGCLQIWLVLELRVSERPPVCAQSCMHTAAAGLLAATGTLHSSQTTQHRTVLVHCTTLLLLHVHNKNCSAQAHYTTQQHLS